MSKKQTTITVNKLGRIFGTKVLKRPFKYHSIDDLGRMYVEGFNDQRNRLCKIVEICEKHRQNSGEVPSFYVTKILKLAKLK